MMNEGARLVDVEPAHRCDCGGDARFLLVVTLGSMEIALPLCDGCGSGLASDLLAKTFPEGLRA